MPLVSCFYKIVPSTSLILTFIHSRCYIFLSLSRFSHLQHFPYFLSFNPSIFHFPIFSYLIFLHSFLYPLLYHHFFSLSVLLFPPSGKLPSSGSFHISYFPGCHSFSPPTVISPSYVPCPSPFLCPDSMPSTLFCLLIFFSFFSLITTS